MARGSFTAALKAFTRGTEVIVYKYKYQNILYMIFSGLYSLFDHVLIFKLCFLCLFVLMYDIGIKFDKFDVNFQEVLHKVSCTK